MRNHLVSQSSAAAVARGGERPLGHADMTRMEFIMIVAGWSTALVAVLIRLFIG